MNSIAKATVAFVEKDSKKRTLQSLLLTNILFHDYARLLVSISDVESTAMQSWSSGKTLRVSQITVKTHESCWKTNPVAGYLELHDRELKSNPSKLKSQF